MNGRTSKIIGRMAAVTLMDIRQRDPLTKATYKFIKRKLKKGYMAKDPAVLKGYKLHAK